jgi:CDP-diglyceride synthetase
LPCVPSGVHGGVGVAGPVWHHRGVFPSPSSDAERDADTASASERRLDEIPAATVRPGLSVVIAGFAAVVGLGLVLGAQSTGPGNRLGLTLAVLVVQLLFLLAWTMAMRPPAFALVASVAAVAAVGADYAAVKPQIAALAPLGYIAVGGLGVGVLGQLVRAADRRRVTESLGATLLLIVGVVAFATLIVLSRKPLGTQAIFVCLAATGVALVVARLADAFFAKPRLTPQVPRGATGVVAGAMLGTLAAGVVGSFVYGFSPTSAAIVGLVAAVAAVLADLASDYAEAGRQMAGDPPTMWVARHMQGPLGGFALASPAAYAMTVLFLG